MQKNVVIYLKMFTADISVINSASCLKNWFSRFRRSVMPKIPNPKDLKVLKTSQIIVEKTSPKLGFRFLGQGNPSITHE